jgi:hypothetical protein
LLPRQRARDQRPDLAGIELKRQVLDRLAAMDPEPEDLDAALLRIVAEIGPPPGPTRAIALSVREEFQTACTTPEWIGYLIEEAARESMEGRRGRRNPE